MVLFKLLNNQWLIRTILAFITGASGTLAFSPYNIWPISIFSLSGLLLVTLNSKIRLASWLGFVWGFGLFSTGINWIYISIEQYYDLPSFLRIASIVLLIIYLSLYPMMFAAVLVKLWPEINLCRMAIGAPTIWSITEFCRSWILTGFPWLDFGYSQIDGPLKGIAPILGVQAITFILMMISGLIVIALVQRHLMLMFAAITLLLLPWPLCLLTWCHPQYDRAIDVALVQGNIMKLMKSKNSYSISALDVYLEHTLPNLGKIKIIIWPESAVPENEINQNKFLIWLDKQLRQKHTSLITGIINSYPIVYGYNYYNSIIVLGEDIPYYYLSKNRYDKHHLVPFGETVQFKNFLSLLATLLKLPLISLSQGQYLQPQLKAAGMKITATICYEIIFGRQLRDNIRSDTDFLLTISNDSWFGNSIGPWQHFQMARMRSLELGRPLLHCTDNGITAVVRADGTLQAQLPQFSRGVLKIKVIPMKGMTPYAIIGYWPFEILIFLIGSIAKIFDHKSYIIKIMNFYF